MNLLRSCVYAAAFYGSVFILSFLMLPTLLLTSDNARVFYRWWARLSATLIRYILRIDYRIEVEEGAALPDGAALVACKHQSAWETLVSYEFLADPAFVLKKELTQIPIFGAYLIKSKQISVDRAAGSKALRGMIADVQHRIEEGRTVVIYPQGTRVKPGVKAPYQPGIAALYRGVDVPVVPIALDSGEYWPRNSFMKKPGIITVRVLKAIEPGMTRSEFLRVLEARIEKACGEIDQNK